MLIPPQSLQKELLDGPLPDRDRLRDNLLDLAWVNRWAGGAAIVLNALDELLAGQKPGPLRILDVGTGGADIPLHIVKWAGRRGLEVAIDAVDLRPEVIDVARELAGHEPAIRLRCADALSLDVPDRSYDFVVTSLTLHHFPPQEARTFLASAFRVASRALIVNDLRRSWPAWLATRLVTSAMRAPEARHDGPLSVLRSYTPEELAAIAKAAGLDDADISTRFPFRLRLIARRT